MSERWDIVSFPEPDVRPDRDPDDAARPGAPNLLARRSRNLGRAMRDGILVDRYELSSRRSFRRFAPAADLALVMGFPFTPAFAAADRLTEAGIPYVVDFGDPLTLSPSARWQSPLRGVALVRGRRLERRLWERASGAIVTTEAFSAALRGAFPGLPILVRPNGYDGSGVLLGRKRVPGSTLRLAHFGSLYWSRIDVRPFLTGLAASGLWEKVEFSQFGHVWDVDVRTPGITTCVAPEVSWDEAQVITGEHDAVIVVGNRSGLGPPSKVTAYMTLPAPRLVLVRDAESDETARYLRTFDSWLAVDVDDSSAPARVAEHVRRPWSAEELTPPESEAWPAVIAQIDAFLAQIAGTRVSSKAIEGRSEPLVGGVAT